MASNLKYSIAMKNAALNARAALIGASALMDVYDGAQPASPDTAVGAQNKLAEFVCNAGGFAATVAGGVLTAAAIGSTVGLFASTATWARIKTAGGTPHLDCTVGTSGTDLIIANVAITIGEPVSVASLTITSGN
jgi:hypothetical protein